MEYRSSFSQHWMFTNCKRWWYYSKIKKIVVVSDMCHADAGTVVHECLKLYYDDKTTSINSIKEEFEKKWKQKKLDESKIKFKKDNYWVMVLDGIKLSKDITSTELKIYYPEVLAYLDGISTHLHEIYDWKTSSQRTEENENEYKHQGLLYALLYYKRFGVLPKKIIFYYLALTNSNKEYIIEPTIKDIKYIEEWYNNILENMKEMIMTEKVPKKCNNCHVFCPYKEYCELDKKELRFVLHIFGNHIQLQGPITELLEKGIKKKFSYELKNAHWIKKARPNANTTVRFYNSVHNTLPLGFRDSLIVTLQHYAEYKKLGLTLDIQDHRVFDKTVLSMPEGFVNGKELRDYQVDAVDVFLRKKVGMLEMGTGSGKTEVVIECIRRLGYKTLFLVDKIELLRQSKKRIEDSLGIEVGIIGAGEDNIKDVTVATIQTISKRIGNYKEFLSNVRFVIFDECHKVASYSYVKISRYLTGTEYRCGLSGTAYRDDGNDMQLTAVSGNIIHHLNSKTLIESGWLVKPQIFFVKNYMDKETIHEWENTLKTGLINESPNYLSYYDRFITKNEFRNRKIVSMINKRKEKRILILTKLIEHGEILMQLLPTSKHLYGATQKEEREKMFVDFVSGKAPILISTISIFAEGIDLPSLDVVINAAANKGDVRTIQVLGRILRKLEGKKDAQYIDFFDESRFFKRASISRRRALINEGHDVDLVSEE